MAAVGRLKIQNDKRSALRLAIKLVVYGGLVSLLGTIKNAYNILKNDRITFELTPNKPRDSKIGFLKNKN